jgi:hypothetical protein
MFSASKFWQSSLSSAFFALLKIFVNIPAKLDISNELKLTDINKIAMQETFNLALKYIKELPPTRKFLFT